MAVNTLIALNYWDGGQWRKVFAIGQYKGNWVIKRINYSANGSSWSN